MSARLFSQSFQVLGWVGKGLLSISLVGAVAFPAFAQDAETPSEVRQVDSLSDSGFSIETADQLADEATEAIAAQQYATAIEKLDEARQLYNQLSLYYEELAAFFLGIDTRQNQSNRQKALEAAQKRDEVTYQLALVYRTQDRPRDAIPLLMDILRSQQPTRELGQQAYQQLFEMGFVDDPYER
ncbi:MAG: hypothetical protein AAGE59_27740 [Cyanobacteria bacterium P01_F01_bin.86]